MSYKPSFTVNSVKRINRATTTSSNFKYNLSIDDDDWDSVTINSCQIPKQWYTLQRGVVGSDDYFDNEFRISEDGGSTYETVTVPPGNYNVFNFPRVLKPLLDAASVSLGNNFQYTISYPDRLTETDTGKFTYNVTNNGGVQPWIRLFDNRIREMMGLGCYDSSGAETPCKFVGNELVSDEQVNMQWTTSVVIKSNIALNNGNKNQDSAILAVIPVTTVPDGSMVVYNSIGLDLDSRELANNGGDLFEFSLYDDQDRLLDLNGGEWFLQLQIFKRNKYYDIATKKMKIDILEGK
jgi:hypothetical protein